ncbi:hypothetical protein ACEWY4_004107 [Coilia grayii]|uniref:Caspase-3-like n=1 Tax=Coilia grayii TaxID=363190 RepID=A0ABD1KKU0_9TELE
MPLYNKARGSLKVCNRAVIVSVGEFDHGVELTRRAAGVRSDTKRLHKVLSKLGFEVEFHNDLSAQEIYTLFKAESKKSVESCFLGIISSHGEEGVVFGADGNPVRLAQIFRLFNEPSMVDKTKLFLVQACRGHGLDDGVDVETDSASFSDEEDNVSDYLSIPVDTAVMYATAPGYGAYMNPGGSVFIQTLCTLLEEDGGRDLEINRLMTRLNYQVAYHFQARGRELAGKKEMPCFVTRLTKEVYPFRASQGNAEGELSTKRSAAVLVEEAQRPRKRSIS